MPVTLKELAANLNLSITTVSRALDDYGDVSKVTKERVRRAAAAVDYVPNFTARRLRQKRSDTIGLVIPTFGPRFADPFFTEFLTGVGNEAARSGFDLLVSTRAAGAQEDEVYRRLALGGRVDGLVLVRTRRDDRRIRYLSEHHVPFVAFGRTGGSAIEYPYVDIDGRAGVRAVVDHLVAAGHTRLGFVAAPEMLHFAAERESGYREGLAAHQLAFDPALLTRGDLTEGSGHEAAACLLALAKPPTAIIACNDLMAFGAMGAVQAAGREVGKDVAVIGFDGVPAAEHSHPPLSTVYQPVYEIGQRVTRILISLLNGEPVERQVLLQPKLIVRASSLR